MFSEEKPISCDTKFFFRVIQIRVAIEIKKCHSSTKSAAEFTTESIENMIKEVEKEAEVFQKIGKISSARLGSSLASKLRSCLNDAK